VTIEAWPDGGLAANRVSEIQVIGGQSAAATTTTLEPSANPSALGAPVTYTATVSPVPDGGTVAFTDGGVPIAGCYSVAVNPSNGSATCRVTYNLAGSHSLIAAYSGDANFRASQSATLSENTATPTTTTVQVYPNPSTPGQEVTYSATVSPDAVTFGIVEVEFVQVTQTSGGAKNVGICTTFAGLTDGTAAQVTCGPVANLSKGAHTVEAIYTGFSEAGTPYDFLPSTSAPYTQDVGVSATTIAPGQTAITTGVCSFNCKVSAKGPTSVPAPSCNLGKAADAASVSPGSGTFHLFTVPQALTQPAATKIANTLQATQNGYNTAKPSKIAAALPPTTCAVAGTANAAIARAGKALAAAMSTAQTFLGPKVSQVLASIYSTHPTHADIEAFSEELALANLTTYEPARTLARFTLFDAFELGRAAIAHQLGDKSVSQLNLSTVTLGSAVAHGKKGSKAPLTITPSVLGGRILRMLEIAGLSHRVTITLTVSTTTNGHTTRSTRTIRVI
jgi:hypothetical protein